MARYASSDLASLHNDHGREQRGKSLGNWPPRPGRCGDETCLMHRDATLKMPDWLKGNSCVFRTGKHMAYCEMSKRRNLGLQSSAKLIALDTRMRSSTIARRVAAQHLVTKTNPTC